ncbi:MAG: choice-of-anchor D domain-containing protein [Planctomycetes bacterium]|nr:choice-of-anchor D domain-containing protein [Planctomycetota bacterium]
MSRKLILPGLLGALALLRSAAHAETVTLPADRDAYVDSSSPGTTLNTAFLGVGRDAADSALPRYRAFLRFDLAAIPAGAQVSSAVLRVNLQVFTGTSVLPVEARRALGAWSETSLTWSSQPGSAAPAVTVGVGAATGTFFNFPIAALVQGWLDGAPNHGVVLQAQDEAAATRVRVFASRSHGNTAVRPELVVSYSTPPEIDVAPSSLAFGSVDVGKVSPGQTVTIVNLGGSALTVSAIDSSDPQFVVSNGPALPASLPAGGSATFQVRFAPQQAGKQSAGVTVASDDSDEPAVRVACAGQGLSPDIQVTPASLAFGSQTVDTTSPPQPLRVKNEGNAKLTVTAVQSSGAQFQVLGVPPLPATVDPGVELAFEVRFKPSAAGERSGAVTIASDDPDEAKVEVPCTGTGAAVPTSDIAVSPASLDFGGVALGTTSPPRPLEVRNEGDAALVVASVATTDPAFVLSGLPPLPATLPPGAAATLQVALRPAEARTYDAQARIASDDPDEPIVAVALRGTGLARPDITATPASLDFGERVVETASPPRKVTVGNVGPGTLRVEKVRSLDSQFHVLGLPPLPLELARGGSFSFKVVFSPDRAGPQASRLSISSNDPHQPELPVGLAGSGVEPSPPPPPPPPTGAPLFRRGDANDSGRIDLSDAVFVLGWLFLGGAEPACRDAADADDSGKIEITDAVFLLGWLFLGGRPPPPPGPVCGPDPGDDALGCAASRCAPSCPGGPVPGAPPPGGRGAAGRGAGLPPAERDTYTVYVQNVYLVPDFIRDLDPSNYDWPTVCNEERAAVIAERILQVDADIVALSEYFDSDAKAAVEDILAADCEDRPDDCYRTRIGMLDVAFICDPVLAQEDSGLALFSKLPALKVDDEEDFCFAEDSDYQHIRGVPLDDMDKYVKFMEYSDAAPLTADALANKGIGLVRLLNVTKDRPEGRPLDVYLTHAQKDAVEHDVRLSQLREARDFIRRYSEYDASDAPARDVLFVGDFNVIGPAPGFPADAACDDGDGEWSLRIGDDCSQMDELALADGWWLTCPAEDPGLTSDYGEIERLDYILANFYPGLTAAAPMPSCIHHMRRYRLQGEVEACDIGLDGNAHDDLMDLTDHFGLIAEIGPRDHHCSPRSGSGEPFDRADEPPAGGGEHDRVYEGAFEDLAVPELNPQPQVAAETLVGRNGNHWYRFQAGTYSFWIESEVAMRLEYYLARDISTPLAAAEGPNVIPPSDPSCPVQRSVVAFVEPFYVRVRCESPEDAGVEYLLFAQFHDCSSYELACWLTEGVEDSVAAFDPESPQETNERWYKLKARRPTLAWKAQEVTIPSVHGGGGAGGDGRILDLEVFRNALEGATPPGAADRLAGPFADAGTGALTFAVPSDSFREQQTTHRLALRVSRVRDTSNEVLQLGVEWRTDLRTITFDKLRCKQQCDDNDDFPIFDIQDDEILLELTVDGTRDTGTEVYSTRHEDVDRGTRVNFKNRAPFQLAEEGGEGDFAWTESVEAPTLYQAPGLTISFTESLYMAFTGLDDPATGDDHDYLGSLGWGIDPAACEGAWEGNVCEAGRYFGSIQVSGNDAATCDERSAYVFEALWSRSAPVERELGR